MVINSNDQATDHLQHPVHCVFNLSPPSAHYSNRDSSVDRPASLCRSVRTILPGIIFSRCHNVILLNADIFRNNLLEEILSGGITVNLPPFGTVMNLSWTHTVHGQQTVTRFKNIFLIYLIEGINLAEEWRRQAVGVFGLLVWMVNLQISWQYGEKVIKIWLKDCQVNKLSD